jgi:hypothetical protein
MIGSGEDAAADTLGVLKSMDRASRRENLEFRGRAGQEKSELLNVHETPDQFIGVEKGKYWFPWSLFVSPSSYGKKGTWVEVDGAHSTPRQAEHRKSWGFQGVVKLASIPIPHKIGADIKNQSGHTEYAPIQSANVPWHPPKTLPVV